MNDIKPKKFARQKSTEVDDFQGWLGTLGLFSTPRLHVNGASYSMAVLTVDFGTPLEEPNKITSDQNAELIFRMKNLTRSLHKTDVNVRVQNDTSNGVWWTTVS